MPAPLGPSSVVTVLVISSDSVTMALMSQLIAMRSDLKLVTANNGRYGLELVSTCHVEVVVLDTDLSDMSGGEVLRRLRQNPATFHIPVVAVSADAHQSQVDAGLLAGFYRYLTMPFKLLDLMKAIDNSPKFSACSGGLQVVRLFDPVGISG